MSTTNREHFVARVVLALGFIAAATAAAPPNRIAGRIDNARRVPLGGHVHPKAQLESDRGRVDSSFGITSLTLVMKHSDAQAAELKKLLAEQQDPASPNYHRWLTPDQYAERFGLSQNDLDKVTAWLRQQNFTVTAVGRGRNWVTVSGNAGDVERAFGTEIHHYLVNGEQHFANSSDPTIPVALQGILKSLHGLTDFRFKPASRALRPNFNAVGGDHYLAPDDFAAIYNVKPLYDSGINGSGQKIVVVGQTEVDLADIQRFRSYFGLPASDPQLILVPASRSPGILSDELIEADLDIEWAGAIARNASIVYVYAQDVNDAVQYAVDQNLAPVISMSYGLCEAQTSRSDALTLQSWAQQANAQGITWFGAAGDSGATDCGSGGPGSGQLSVDIPASIPEVTGIGGTTFNDSNGTYWASADSATHSSALGYIPETAWNDGASGGDISATGGGASVYFSNPSWQTGAGVPANSARNVPDVAFSASVEHVGYLVYNQGSRTVVGGTSAGVPTFAAIAALLNQRLVSSGLQAGLGNMNARLYALAQTTPSAFHDITTGDNLVTVTCFGPVRNCTPGSLGYKAGAGYDQVTGLGSVNAYNLVVAWQPDTSAVTRASATVTLASTATSLRSGESATITATVKGTGDRTPSGTVTFYSGSDLLGSSRLAGSGGTATATLTVDASQLGSGARSITAQYSGDSAFNTATGSLTISVTITASAPAIAAVVNGASFGSGLAPGAIVSIFGSELAIATRNASVVPLPSSMSGVSVLVNGVAAPLFYISPAQLNVQVPYEVVPNTTAVLEVNNNGLTASTLIPISAAAPALFTGALPANGAARGEVITLYITGAGLVSPSIASGSAPAAGTVAASLPKPVQSVGVTIGGLDAPVQFAGIPTGLVGVAQINCQVPTAASLGSQTLVVNVGGIDSPSATIEVHQ